MHGVSVNASAARPLAVTEGKAADRTSPLVERDAGRLRDEALHEPELVQEEAREQEVVAYALSTASAELLGLCRVAQEVDDRRGGLLDGCDERAARSIGHLEDPLIHVLTNLTGVGNTSRSTRFNASRTCASRKSTREGFGLVVSESLCPLGVIAAYRLAREEVREG